METMKAEVGAFLIEYFRSCRQILLMYWNVISVRQQIQLRQDWMCLEKKSTQQKMWPAEEEQRKMLEIFNQLEKSSIFPLQNQLGDEAQLVRFWVTKVFPSAECRHRHLRSIRALLT